MPCWAVGQSLTALAANSLGAGKAGEAESLNRAALRLNVCISLAVVAAVQVSAQPLSAFLPALVGGMYFYSRKWRGRKVI